MENDPVGLLAAKYHDVPFIDVCPDLPEVSRCEEMLRWLSEHQAVQRYVVIDDESDCLDDLPLFQPSSKTGLTIEIVEGVEKYLSGKDGRYDAPTRHRSAGAEYPLVLQAGQKLAPVQQFAGYSDPYGESAWRAPWSDQFWRPSPLSITAVEGRTHTCLRAAKVPPKAGSKDPKRDHRIGTHWWPALWLSGEKS